MIDDNDDTNDDIQDEINIIDKMNILIALIQKTGPKGQVALLQLLEEAKFQLFYAWNEANYYRELCEGYEKAIDKLDSGLRE
jgi:hypothetical protein